MLHDFFLFKLRNIFCFLVSKKLIFQMGLPKKLDPSYCLLDTPAVISQGLAFFTEVLRMFFALVRDVQPIRFFQRTLFMWVDIDVTFDAFLSHVGPTVTAHPLSFAFGTLVFSKAAFFALIRCQSFTFGPCLRTVFDVVTFLET